MPPTVQYSVTMRFFTSHFMELKLQFMKGFPLTKFNVIPGRHGLTAKQVQFILNSILWLKGSQKYPKSYLTKTTVSITVSVPWAHTYQYSFMLKVSYLKLLKN